MSDIFRVAVRRKTLEQSQDSFAGMAMPYTGSCNCQKLIKVYDVA